MTDEEWTAEITKLFELRRREPAAVVARSKRLSRRAAQAERHAVGAAHIADSLALAAITLSEAGKHREAARLFRGAARVHERVLRRHGFSRGSALASAALELFKAGANEPAARIATEALRSFGQFPDPSSIHEEVLRRLRAHLQERATRRRRRGAG